MAFVNKRLYKGTLAATEGTLYTVPAGKEALIKAVTICNITDADELVTLKFGDLEIVSEHLIMARDTITIPFWDQILTAAETIKGTASEASAINVLISGKEEA